MISVETIQKWFPCQLSKSQNSLLTLPPAMLAVRQVYGTNSGMAPRPHIFSGLTDRQLGLLGFLGLGVSFMEPRLFWLGSIICFVVAAITVREHAADAKKVLTDIRRFRNYSKKKKTHVPPSLLATAAIIFLCLGLPPILYFTQDRPVLNYGILESNWYERLISFLSPSPPIIYVGGARFVGGSNDASLYLFPALGRDEFEVKRTWSGQIIVSTDIRDRNGKIIATIKNNKWQVSSAALDRNYNSNSLEVIDEYNNVVLQVTLASDKVGVQGMWWINMGPPNGVRRLVARKSQAGAQFIIVPANSPEDDPSFPKIDRIFNYPSGLHLGELAN